MADDLRQPRSRAVATTTMTMTTADARKDSYDAKCQERTDGHDQDEHDEMLPHVSHSIRSRACFRHHAR